MKSYLLLITLLILVSCKGNSQKPQNNNLDIVKYHVSDSGVQFELQDWGEKELKEYHMLLEKAKTLIEKYSPQQSDIFNAKNLDLVLEKWKENKSPNKESKKEIMTLIGASFGKDLNDSFNCEWKIYYDNQGSDFTVIHKVYKMNLFPFSTVYKAIELNKKGSLYDLKKTFKHNINEAEKNGDYTKW
ncbi:hypothetical protein [uncultured Tenacibaculum sp.]|uniref:DUF3806 domain-containing protein n=1 Tax=uncultured Tenacibaculum sp. TaxID=174713 RepID=UPI002631CF8D|nr:hypothetical protein [uncultured Tenacibaculum sp.]